ncbi:MAG TPA: ComGF family competence protein [Pseudogracilibacillus sp.]|nr:ComGF family competence protein [Pseudogracilibacillus sp.]
MGTMKNESAFTFLEMMIVLSIIIITFPFITFLLEKIHDEDYNETVSVNQFFNYLQKDAFKAREVYHDGNKLYFVINEYDTALIEPYEDVIRRRVNYRGHEIYLRDVEKVHIQPKAFGYHYTIVTTKGESYDKIIHSPS